MVLDGEELRTNPGRVMDKVQGFIGLPRCLKNENFVFNETKGFYCILDKDGNQQCLDSNKGTSRKRLLKLNLTSSDMEGSIAPRCSLKNESFRLFYVRLPTIMTIIVTIFGSSHVFRKKKWGKMIVTGLNFEN